jgi:hypothetical protein
MMDKDNKYKIDTEVLIKIKEIHLRDPAASLQINVNKILKMLVSRDISPKNAGTRSKKPCGSCRIARQT